jgi:beta-glucosidase
MKVEELLSQMTIEEKIGQLIQTGPSIVGAFGVSFEELLNMMFDGKISKEEFDQHMASSEQDYHEEDIRAGRMGSFNGVKGAEKVNELQKIAVTESRLGIPLLFGYDVIHGLRTVTPIPLGESCAFDEELWEETARLSAVEATANGIHWTFAPMIDVARDARWGRVSESAGEDVLLNSAYAKAKVKGFQGEDLSHSDSIIACAKHYVAYGAAEGGRDYNTVDISEQRLREVYLPPFKAAIDAGCATIMPAFNDVSGVPSTINKWLLQDIARDEFGFDGVYVSDANAIAECVDHGCAANKKEAASLAIMAGINIDMSSHSYEQNLGKLIEENKSYLKELDKAVAYVLKLKMKKGLFENPYQTNKERETKETLSDYGRSLARKAAVKSMVLLKNEDVLPLSKNLKIGLTGDLASLPDEMLGAWAIGGQGDDCVTLLDGLKAAAKNVVYQACICNNQVDLSRLDRLAQPDIDVIVVAAGERKDMSGEAASRSSIELAKEQKELILKLKERGKKVIVVLFNGRPLAIPEIAEHADAILEAWHPGIEAGHAICDILFGDENPSGKLTTTFPYTTGVCPCYYSTTTTGRPAGKGKFTSKYLDTPINHVVFPFGYGLSYTEFEYDNLEVIELEENIEIRVLIKNIGKYVGEEIVQLYVQDMVASRVRPAKELKAFKKINLKPNAYERVIFKISKRALGFYNARMEYVVEPGIFRFCVGKNSQDCLEKEWLLK